MPTVLSTPDTAFRTGTEAAAPVPPRYLLARLSCALAIFAALMASTTPSPLYPIYIAEWGLRPSAGTSIFAIYAVGTLISLALSGWLDGRTRDRRQVILPALVLTAAGAILFALASQVWMLLLGRFLSGLATGLITGTASAAIHALSRPERRQRAAAVSTVVFTAGAASGPCLSSAALATGIAPLVSPFVVIALTAALAFLGLALAPWPRRVLAGARAAATAAADPERISPEFRRRLYLLSCLAITTAWTLGSMLMATGVSLATDLFGLHVQAVAGLIPALFQLFAGIGQMAFSRTRPLSAILTGALALGLLQVVIVLGAITGTGLIFILAMPLCGLFYGAAFVGGASLVNATSTPADIGRRIAVFYVVGYLSNAIPTFVMGFLINSYGLATSFDLFSVLMVVIATLATLLALRLRPRSLGLAP